MGLRIHKLADRSDGRGAPWPLAGVRLLDAPDATQIPTNVVADAIAQGWATGEDGRQVVRPSGRTPDDLTKPPHVFVHYSRIIFHTLDGDVTYRVLHQPDKYADPGDDTTPVTAEVYAAGATRVDWFYGVGRES